jgi:hypothetical protein
LRSQDAGAEPVAEASTESLSGESISGFGEAGEPANDEVPARHTRPQ